jgi:hypothetical protein
MKQVARLLLIGGGLLLARTGVLAQVNKACPAPGTEVPFAKVINEAFAPDYVGCDITTRVQFVAAGGTPNYYWGRVKGTDGKAPFRVVVPGDQPGTGPFDIPPHVFLPKDKADVIFSFKKGDLLIIRGAPSVGPPGIPVAFIATEVSLAKL